MNIKRFFVLSLFLALGMMAFAQKTTGQQFRIDTLPEGVQGMIVKYVLTDSVTYAKGEIPKESSKWITLGSVQKPLPIPAKNEEGKIIYQLRGLEVSSYYVVKLILVYNGKMQEEIVCGFLSPDDSDDYYMAVIGEYGYGTVNIKGWKKKTDKDLKQQRK